MKFFCLIVHKYNNLTLNTEEHLLTFFLLPWPTIMGDSGLGVYNTVVTRLRELTVTDGTNYIGMEICRQ
jgi:hypothetical protein